MTKRSGTKVLHSRAATPPWDGSIRVLVVPPEVRQSEVTTLRCIPPPR